MALCLAESLVVCNGFNALDQMQRYVRWYRDGYLSSTGTCLDIGGTTRSSLERFEQTGNPFAGSSATYMAGNGSLMRLASVPMWYAENSIEAIEKSGESSRTTHGAAVAVLSLPK